MIEIKINSKQLLLEGATIEKWKAEESLRAMMQAYLEGRPKGTKPIIKINPDTGAFSFDNPTGKVEVGAETLPGQRSKGPIPQNQANMGAAPGPGRHRFLTRSSQRSSLAAGNNVYAQNKASVCPSGTRLHSTFRNDRSVI